MMREIECPIHIFHKNYSNSEYDHSAVCQNAKERNMNFQELNYILCIARHQNLTKAAQELYISQPTLTKHLQKLEREMNGKLFVRSGNVYTATYLGRRYMEYARKVLAVNQDWEKELQDLTSYNEGELNIAFPLMRSSCLVPQIMEVFHEQYPGVRVNLREETYAIQERLLLDDQLDFAIFNEAKPHPKLVYETLLREEILLVMPEGHPLASQAVKRSEKEYPWIDLRLLRQEPFILHFPEQTTGQIALELFEKYGMNPPVPIRTRNTVTCVKLCQKGLGLCFIPENYMKNIELKHPPLCFSIGDEDAFSPLTLAYRKGAYLPAYARDFIRIAQQKL